MQGDKAGQWFNRENSSLYLSLTRGKSVVSVWKYELHFIPPPIDIYIILGGSQLIVTLLAPREGGWWSVLTVYEVQFIILWFNLVTEGPD